jgi:GNAT superfamily N-acetyltransferase
MSELEPLPWSWELSADAEEVHALLCASDAYHATPGSPAPLRSLETTRRRVGAGSVHLLRRGSEAVAMFTLTWDPPFEGGGALFPPARKPAYLGRLAVHPDWLARGSIVGAQCLRRAVEVATRGGADVLRSEANPDLTQVRALLGMFGFQEHGRSRAEDGRPRVYLQKALI